MRLKNFIAVLMIVLTLGVLFTGCGNTSETVDDDSVVDTGSTEEPIVNEDPAPVSGQDSEVTEVVEDDLDEDVEIGSLI